MGLGTPGRWGNLHRWGNKLTLLYMQSYNLLHPGVRFLKIIERSRIMLANHVFWRLMLFYSHLLLLLQPSLLWLFIVTFLNDANPLPNWYFAWMRRVINPTPTRWVNPPWNIYMANWPQVRGLPWQTGISALVGHPTYHVNMIKLKWTIIWPGGLPHLSGLPRQPLPCKQALSQKF